MHYASYISLTYQAKGKGYCHHVLRISNSLHCPSVHHHFGMWRNHCSSPPPRSWHRLERSRGRSRFPPPFFFFFFSFFGAHPFFLGTRPGRRAKGSLQRAASRGLRTGNLEKMYAAMIYYI